jgi:NAD-dependent DNA ligase
MESVIDINILKNYDYNEFKIYLESNTNQKLLELKSYFDNIYYNTDITGISDEKYDLIVDTIKTRDPDYHSTIGYTVREGENRVRLPYWLGSMDKIKPEDVNVIARWILKNPAEKYIIETKLDGISALFIFKNNEKKLYTRGDGIIGAGISYLIEYVNNIPNNLNSEIVVRGELIMKKRTFETKFSSNYANPRNMVAGRLGGKILREGIHDIDFIAYEIITEQEEESPSTQINRLNSMGFTTVRNQIISTVEIEELINSLFLFKETSEYEIDGIIVQPDKEYIRNISGNPDYAFAFKMRFEENLKQTEVLEVEWNISKWGQLKPVVIIKPIQLGGVTNSKATGHNGKFIFDNNIGPGAIISITRSGDVIPYIVAVIQPATDPQMPDIPYKWDETRTNIFTETNGCEMCVKLLTSFFSSLGVKFVSESTIRKLHNNGYNNLFKILRATEDEISVIETFGKVSAKRIYNNIHNNLQNLSIPLVLGASGVFGFGLGKKRIETLFKDIPDILTIYKNISRDEMIERVLNVEGFAEKTALKIVDNLIWADKLIFLLSEFATFEKEIIENDNEFIFSKKFVMSGFRDKNLENEIVRKGGKIVSSVSKNTDFLIVKNLNETSSKIIKARELSIRVIEVEEFKTNCLQ